jgi:uncharacterized membrane protein YfbV (UPF0208 family)
MTIHRLTASFGQLNNETLTLKEGFNIVEAPNESGKSTWGAFLRAMLFGVSTSDRDKGDYLADKSRYAPWGGAPMEGELELTCGLGELTLRRAALGKVPMKRFSAAYTVSGEPVPGVTGENAGETLTGVTEPVFRRSAFIAQSGVRVDQTPELEKKIAALIGAGDETSSYTQADERLRAWMRRRRYNKLGEIPALDARLAELDRKLSALESKNDETAALRAETERLEAEKTRLTRQLRAHDAYRAQSARESAVMARKSMEDLSSRAEAAREARADAVTARDASAVHGHSAREITQQLDLLARERREIPSLARGALILLVSFAVCVIAQYLYSREIFNLSAAVLLILFAVFLAPAGFLWRGKRVKRCQNALLNYLAPFGASSEDALRAALTDYAALCERAERAADTLETAVASAALARTAYEALPGAQDALPDAAVLPPPDGGSREETAELLEVVSLRLANVSSRYHAASGELRALGDPAVLGSARNSLAERRQTLQEQYDAIEIAAETLRAANTEMSSRFSPLLSGAASGILARLTDGRYEKLSFTRDFDISAQTGGETLPHSLLWLSAGTAEQAYLALRLALCELILPEASLCPIVLDDALGSFDDERAGFALDYLRELSAARQIILFTCHGIEAGHFTKDDEVNVVRLPPGGYSPT